MFLASRALIRDLCLVLFVSILRSECHRMQQDKLCNPACSVSSDVQRGIRHTYRYSTTITSALKGTSSGNSQLALDCVVDIDVLPECPLMVLKLRNPQIKRTSSQRDNAVLRLKSLRESLEKSPLRFSLLGGKVTALCPREAEQVWTLNIKRAILSMLQTSHSGGSKEMVRETDVYGTCTSSYERRGPVWVKTRSLQQCLKARLDDFWQHSVPLKEDTAVNASVQCAQHYGAKVMEKVNCTETVALVPLSGMPGVVQTQTVSTLTLLRTLEGTPLGSDMQKPGRLTDLQYEEELGGPVRGKASSSQEAFSTVRKLCAQTADQQQQSELFLSLALQLRALSLQQLRALWQEASFKCRDDWQPLLDALPACGSEECIILSTNLILNNEIEQERTFSFLNGFAFAPRPSPTMIGSINALLQAPVVRPKALLAVSSLVHRLCQRDQHSCSQIPEVQRFVEVLKESLGKNCGRQELSLSELLHVLKAVGNAGLAASSLTPQLDRCIHNDSAPLELRLASIQAFRRIPCSADRGALAWAYQSPRGDVELRIGAYQQLMLCPNQDVFRIVRTTLSNETSSQVGSFVWSHLTNLQKTEDPLKLKLMESLPDDIISKDFEAESWKYSSHLDLTLDTGLGLANVEGALVFSPKSFLPRSARTNLTVQILGRAFNLLEVDLRVANMEPLLKSMFGGQSTPPDPQRRKEPSAHGRRRRRSGNVDEGEAESPAPQRGSGKKGCKSNTFNHLRHVKAKSTGEKAEDDDAPRCWISMKVFGNELTFMTCDDLYAQLKELSLNVAGVAVKLLKGLEVKFNHRAVVLAEELVLPSLSGLPFKLGINMSSLFTLQMRGSASYKDWSHFSLDGYIKPKAHVSISARMGVDGALGQIGLEWATRFRTSTSLDGSVQLQHGQNLKVVLNTPEDVMEIVSFSSRMYRVSGDNRDELTGSRNRMEKTNCTPKPWSKMVGCQLCSDVSYPLSLRTFPFPGPTHLSLRLLKLDRGLHQYLLEAAYASAPQRDSWVPLEATLHLFLGTPQSTIPRDVSLDLSLSPQRLVLKMTHYQKTFLIQGQLDHVRGMRSGKVELLVDNIHHYYVKGLMETLTLLSEKRHQYLLEAKMATDVRPIILSVNVTHGLSRKISMSVVLKNVFKEAASFLVQLERRQDEGQRQYSVDAELVLPGLLGGRALGLLEHRASEWSSALRLRYGLREEAGSLWRECQMSQSLRSEMEALQTFHMRAEHELHCSHTASFNHKIQLRHEQSPTHTQSTLDLSCGKHWDQSSNKRRILLSQSFRNQSRHGLTSYALEFSLRVPERMLNYRTQLLHSRLRRRRAESSTHLKVNYNDQMPLVAGLHWRELSSKASPREWEGTFNMDTPWLYMYIAHRLSQPQRGTTQFSSELTARKWITIRSLALEGLYREKSREREGWLHVFTPAVTYVKAGGQAVLGRRSLKASCSLTSAWTPALRGEVTVGNSRQLKTLELSTGYGMQNLSLSASLSTLDMKLKKRLVMMKMMLSELRSPYVELAMEGGVEEVKKDGKMYQKRWKLHLRQPFHFLPQNLLLQETFTVDLHQGVYILETRFHLHGNREAVHTLTIGYQPQSPYVCSSLTHPFSSETIPQDSEMCVTMHSDKMQREVQGRFRIDKMDRLLVLGHGQLNGPDSPQRGIKIQANLTQLLQLQVPSSVSLEGDVSWNHRDYRVFNSVFDYLSKAKVIINHQESQFAVRLNGSSNGVGLYSSLSHPYNSKIPKTLQAHASAEISPAGSISGSLGLRADGKDRAMLEVLLTHTLQNSTRAIGVYMGLHQTLLPSAAVDTRLQLAANVSSDSLSVLGALEQGGEAFWAQLTGALERSPGHRVSLTGDLKNSLPGLATLPCAVGLQGILTQSGGLTEGELTVIVDEAAYGLELSHQEVPGQAWEEGGLPGGEPGGTRGRLCVVAVERSLCVNVSRISRRQGQVDLYELYAQQSHSFPWLLNAGLPFDSSAAVSWAWGQRELSGAVELHAGSRGLGARLETGPPSPTGASKHFQVNCTGGFGADHLLGCCYGDVLDRTLEVEVWANLTESRSSVSVHSELNSSLAFIIQGHYQNASKVLMVNIVHNISFFQPYLPSEFYTLSQLNHSGSSVQGKAELQVARGRLCFLAELAVTEAGYSQVLEFNHSFTQLQSVPRTVTVRTVYEEGNGTQRLLHRALWGAQDFGQSVSSTAPAKTQLGHQKVQTASVPYGWGLELRLESVPQRRRVDVVLDWTVHGVHEQAKALGSWRTARQLSEGTVTLMQPFTHTLSQLQLHTLSHRPADGHGSITQVQLSWDRGRPVNVSLTVSQHRHADSSRGRACVLLSPGQMQAVLPLVDVEGCVSVAQQGNSYSQNAELKWSDKRITQSMKYQRGARGAHALQVEAEAQNVSPPPCSSHTLLAHVHTNGRDSLEHRVMLGLCSPHPALGWAGYHRVNAGKQLFYTQTRLSVSGQPQHSSFTLALLNTSTSQRTNYSVLTEWQVGNWSLELGGSGVSSGRGPGLLLQARLDRSERVWLQGALQGRCLRAAAGYDDDSFDDITVALCLEGRHRLTLEAQRQGGGVKKETLALVSMSAANQSLTFGARGCAECLWALEAEIHQLGSRFRNRLLQRVQKLQHLLIEFRQQSSDSSFLQELSDGPLCLTQRAEALLLQRSGVVWAASPLRHTLTESLPHFLRLLHHITQLVQQELRKPLATLAGAYHDVTGQRLDALWQEAVALWTGKLAELLPAVLEDHHLRAPSQAALRTVITIVDMVSQQTVHWAEARLAAALVGVRRRLASMYKVSHSDCEVTVRVPLPRGSWSQVAEAGVTEVLLEEFLLRPLLALNSLSPAAEFYRLKRRLMDSPFNHQALLVADQFAVSFDGQLYELPASCGLVLASDVTAGSYSITLSPDSPPQRSLVVQMKNTTVTVHSDGKVEVDCHAAHTPYTDNDVTVRRDLNLIEVSNERGVQVACDPSLSVCSVTLDGWLHGVSTGLLGTNDNEAGNEFPLPDGSQAGSWAEFARSWEVDPQCGSEESQRAAPCVCLNQTADSLLCEVLFSSPHSPLCSCFKVVDPEQFLSVCGSSLCDSVDVPNSTPCRLATAYVHLCHRQYVPLELPMQCVRV